MKNVRLFAVAAAMGMFASTVSAAAPKVEKNAFVATWGEVEEIIKVDVNDKVVAPNATISVVKETRTTDSDYKTVDGTLGLVGRNTCYVGFTNEVGKDTNKDGLVDTPVLAMATTAVTDGWYYTNAKFWPTAKTSLYYVGLAGGDIYGKRFLAAGSEASKGYHIAHNHTDLADVDAVLAYMEEQGFIKRNYNSKGVLVSIDMFETTVYDTNAKGKVDKSMPLGSLKASWVVTDRRYADEELAEAVVDAFVNGGSVKISNEYANLKYKYSLTTGNLDQKAEEFVEVEYYADVYNKVADEDAKETIKLEKGGVYEIGEDRYGDFYVISGNIATGSDLDAAAAKFAREDKITLVTGTRSGYELFSRVTPKKITEDYATIYKMEFGFDGIFERVNVIGETRLNDKFEGEWTSTGGVFKGLTEEDFEPDTHHYGLYYYEAEANTSDKIVINTHGTDLNLEIVNINKNKGTMTLTAPDAKTDIVVSAVELKGEWYPAVDTEDELVEFVEIMMGLHTPGEDKGRAGSKAYEDWASYETVLENAEAYSKITYLDGSVDAEYIPANGLAHYKAKQCTYKKAEGEDVSSEVVFSSDADAIDTTTPGVKTLTLTAKVGADVVGTKEVKVVVAPKYERVYKNGKVATLKAFRLNGTPYAVYNYDWAAKTYTATFYENDGVTVASTANGSL